MAIEVDETGNLSSGGGGGGGGGTTGTSGTGGSTSPPIGTCRTWTLSGESGTATVRVFLCGGTAEQDIEVYVGSSVCSVNRPQILSELSSTGVPISFIGGVDICGTTTNPKSIEVSFDTPSVRIPVGGAATITANIKNVLGSSAPITFSSGNIAIATVSPTSAQVPGTEDALASSTQIRGISAGTTTVNINVGGATAVASVVVYDPNTTVTLATNPAVGGGSISIDGNATGLYGRTVTITATPATTHTFTRFDLSDGSTRDSSTITFPVNTNITVTAVFTAIAIPVVTIAPASAAITVAKGGPSVINTINITRTNYTGDVNLAVTNLPGITAAITPNPTTTNEFVISLVAAANATAGAYTVSCTATYGTRTATTSFQLTVTAASTTTLSLSATSVTMQKSATATSTVTAVTTNLTDQQPPVTVVVSEGTPANTNAVIVTNPFTQTTQLRITTTAASPSGTFTLRLTGTTASGLTATTSLILTISEGATPTPTPTPTATPDGPPPPPPGDPIPTFSPELSSLLNYSYQRGSSLYPASKTFSIQGNSSSHNYTITLRTNPGVIFSSTEPPSIFTHSVQQNASVAVIKINRTSKVLITVNLTQTFIDSIPMDGLSEFNLQVGIARDS